MESFLQGESTKVFVGEQHIHTHTHTHTQTPVMFGPVSSHLLVTVPTVWHGEHLTLPERSTRLKAVLLTFFSLDPPHHKPTDGISIRYRPNDRLLSDYY